MSTTGTRRPLSVEIKYEKYILPTVASLLSGGLVVGWFNGRMEMGPRSLGCRSVLADPRKQEMKTNINKYLKKREPFVPFAPSIAVEEAERFIVGYDGNADFMIMAYDATDEAKELIPAVVHVDGTIRPQIVREETNPMFHKLIMEFKKRSGVACLLNTSFNRHGLPIVMTIKDAIEHLEMGCVDILTVGNYLIKRTGRQ